MYNVQHRSFRLITVVMEKQRVLHILCVCSLSYPACKACALFYIVISGLSGSTVFLHIISNGTNYEKKNIDQKMCFDFLYNLVWNFSHSKKSLARCDLKCILVLMQSSLYTCEFLIQLGFFQEILEN
jgi:hypothetical protein